MNMTHEEFLRSLATRFHSVIRGRGDPNGHGVLLSAIDQGDARSEAVARWLAWHVALYFQRCSRVDFESCVAWQYWHRHEREDVDWTVYTGNCETHRNHPERTRIKVRVLRASEAGYTCELFDFSTRFIERTIGVRKEQPGRIIIGDSTDTIRQ